MSHSKRVHEMPEFYAAKTRRELLWFIWNEGLTDVNVFKEGRKYAVQVGKIIYATPATNLSFYPVRWWIDCIKKGYFPI